MCLRVYECVCVRMCHALKGDKKEKKSYQAATSWRAQVWRSRDTLRANRCRMSGERQRRRTRSCMSCFFFYLELIVDERQRRRTRSRMSCAHVCMCACVYVCVCMCCVCMCCVQLCRYAHVLCVLEPRTLEPRTLCVVCVCLVCMCARAWRVLYTD